MNKCFITKLPSSVDNDNLPVLGQLRINWSKQSNLTDNDARAIGLATNDSITIKVSGAHLTDNTLSSNLGNTKTITAADGVVWLYVSNDADAVLTIDNKYSLTWLNFIRPSKPGLKRSVEFDINDIRYCTALTVINLMNTQVSGDISALSQLTALTNIDLTNTQVSGDISALSKLTALTVINLTNTQVSGNISALSKLTALTVINLTNTQVSGDISALSKLTSLIYIFLSNTNVSGNISAIRQLTDLAFIELNNTQVSGDISSVSQLTNLRILSLGSTQVSGNISAISQRTALTFIDLNSTNVSGEIDSLANLTKLSMLDNLKGLSLTGDMSKIPARVNFISQIDRKVTTNFTWTAKGRQNATLLAMEGPIPFDTTSMDNMFIDQATCTLKESDSQPWTKTISVSGTRTSASDAAVAAIQNMGVTITGVTKQA